jgi:hypothetical protein
VSILMVMPFCKWGRSLIRTGTMAYETIEIPISLLRKYRAPVSNWAKTGYESILVT